MKNITNYIDQKFGRLTVWSQWVGKRYRLMGFCKCDCGREKVIRISHLKSGAIISCGCESAKRIKHQNLRHHLTHTTIHNIWKGMRQRCLNPNSPAYKDYGGRGIKICNDWLNSFEVFASDMGPIPGPGYSIDRINNDGNYEPSNCRWATKKAQANNRRKRQIGWTFKRKAA